MLVLNEPGEFDFQFDGSECGTKYIGNCKEANRFFYLMVKPVLWRILVEETNRYAKTHNTSDWKDVMTAEMKVFLSVIFNMGLIKRNNFNDYWRIKYESQSTRWFRKMFNSPKKKKYSSTKSCLTNASWFCVIMNDQKMQRYDTTKE